MVSFFAFASIVACCGATAATEDIVSYTVAAPSVQQEISSKHSVLAPSQTHTSANDPTSFLRKRRSNNQDEEERFLEESCNLPVASADYDCALHDKSCSVCCWYDKNDVSIAFADTTKFDKAVTPYTDIVKQCYSKADGNTGISTCHCGPEPAVSADNTAGTQTQTQPQATSGTCRVPKSVYDCGNHDDECSECCWYTPDMSESNFNYNIATTNSKQCYKKQSAAGDTCHCGPVPTNASNPNGNASPNASPSVDPEAFFAGGGAQGDNSAFGGGGGGQCTIPGDSFDCAGYGSTSCGDCCYYNEDDLTQASTDPLSLEKPSLECYRKSFDNGSNPVCVCGPVGYMSDNSAAVDATQPAPLSTLGTTEALTCDAPGESVTCGTDCETCCLYNVNDPTEIYGSAYTATTDVLDQLTKACYMQTHSSGSETCTCGPIPETLTNINPAHSDNGTCLKPGEEVECGENPCDACCFYNVNDQTETYSSTAGLTNTKINDLTKACYEATLEDDSKKCTCGPIPPSDNNGVRFLML